MPGSVRTRWIVAAVVVAAAAGAVVAFWPDSAAAVDPEIAVSRSACGTGWADPKPGPQTFRLHNTGSVTVEVDLIDPATGVIYGEVEGLGAGDDPAVAGRPRQRQLRVPVPARGRPGRDRRPGRADHRRGRAAGPGVVPVTHNDLLGPLKAYQQYVMTGLDQLVADTGALKNTVHGGDRAASEAAWLTAHLTYERLGAAYDAFGDSDGAINGTAGGLPGGAADQGFTGFHRLE